MTSQFEIILGTYEQYVLGYQFSAAAGTGSSKRPAKTGTLKQTFAVHSHSSSVRCVCYDGRRYIASGGADDRIVVYDMHSRKEHCMLTHHDNTVTALAFNADRTHIFTGSQDGVFAVVRIGNWQVEKQWDKAHNGQPILDIAVHASGKLALTLGGDRTLKSWNLVKGRSAYVINLTTKCRDAQTVTGVKWAPDEKRFLLFGGRHSEVWSIDTGGLIARVEHGSRLTTCYWLSDTQYLVAFDDGHIATVDTSDNTVTESIEVGESRVKCICVYGNYFVTASSNGDIMVFDKGNIGGPCVAKANAKCRITSMCIAEIVTKLEPEEETVTVEDVAPTRAPAKRRGQVIVEVEDDSDDGIKVVKVAKKMKTSTSETSTTNVSSKNKGKTSKVKFVDKTNEVKGKVTAVENNKAKTRSAKNTKQEKAGSVKDNPLKRGGKVVVIGETRKASNPVSKNKQVNFKKRGSKRNNKKKQKI